MKFVLFLCCTICFTGEIKNGFSGSNNTAEDIYIEDVPKVGRKWNYTLVPMTGLGDEIDDAGNILNNLAALGEAAEASDIISAMLPQLEVLSAMAPELAVFGAVLGLVSIFTGPSVSLEVQLLKQIQNQIASLEGEMKQWFQAIAQDNKYLNCFNTYSQYEFLLMAATDALAAYSSRPSEYNKQAFMALCENGQCDLAVQTLLNSLNGNSGTLGCDLMTVMYYGDKAQDIPIGSFSVFPASMSYLTHLITVGINAQSAYYSIRSQDQNAYKEVSQAYHDKYQAFIARQQSFLYKSISNFWTNFKDAVKDVYTRRGPDKCIVVNSLSQHYGARYWLGQVQCTEKKSWCYSVYGGQGVRSHGKSMVGFAVPKSSFAKCKWHEARNGTQEVSFLDSNSRQQEFSPRPVTDSNLDKPDCSAHTQHNHDICGCSYSMFWGEWGSGYTYCRNIPQQYWYFIANSKVGDDLEWCYL